MSRQAHLQRSASCDPPGSDPRQCRNGVHCPRRSTCKFQHDGNDNHGNGTGGVILDGDRPMLPVVPSVPADAVAHACAPAQLPDSVNHNVVKLNRPPQPVSTETSKRDGRQKKKQQVALAIAAHLRLVDPSHTWNIETPCGALTYICRDGERLDDGAFEYEVRGDGSVSAKSPHRGCVVHADGRVMKHVKARTRKAILLGHLHNIDPAHTWNVEAPGGAMTYLCRDGERLDAGAFEYEVRGDGSVSAKSPHHGCVVHADGRVTEGDEPQKTNSAQSIVLHAPAIPTSASVTNDESLPVTSEHTISAQEDMIREQIHAENLRERPPAFHVFLGHRQMDSAARIANLQTTFEERYKFKTWCDLDQIRQDQAAMIRGVAESSVYILFLSKNACSYFVTLEARAAMMLAKPVVVFIENDPRSASYAGTSIEVATAMWPRDLVAYFETGRYISWGGQPFEWDSDIRLARIKLFLKRCEELDPATPAGMATWHDALEKHQVTERNSSLGRGAGPHKQWHVADSAPLTVVGASQATVAAVIVLGLAVLAVGLARPWRSR